jgi:radical SAM protein with 4Fe4S-binding SPASM domain
MNNQTSVMKMEALWKEADLSNYPNHVIIPGTTPVHAWTFDESLERYRNYRKEWVLRGKDHLSGNFPLHVDIETANFCNLRCTMCAIDFTLEKGKLISWDLVKQIIDEGASYGLPSLKFNFRGEPLLHPELPRYVRYAKEKGILETQFNTNAMLLHGKMAEGLLDSGLDRMIVSMDGVTAETYNKIRVHGNFDRVLKNVQEFIRMRNERGLRNPMVRIQMVCMYDNQQDILAFIQYWRGIVDHIGLIRYRNPEGEMQSGQRIDLAPTQTIPCRQLWQRLMVTSDGRVLMCCGDHDAREVLGRLQEQSLKEIWDGATLGYNRMLHLEGRSDEMEICRKCEVNKVAPKEEWVWLK